MSPLSCIFISLLLDLLSFTLILPLMPAILTYYSKHDTSGLFARFMAGTDVLASLLNSPSTQDRSVVLGGILGSWFSLLQFLCSPLLGSLSDLLGRRMCLLSCLLGISLSYSVWMMSAASFLLFCLSRTILGLSKGNITLCTAIVADLSNQKDRTKGMVMVGIAFSIGFIVGPSIGAGLSILTKGDQSSNIILYPAAMALVLSVANLTFTFLCIDETLPQDKRAKSVGTGISQAIDLVNPVSLFSFSPVQGIQARDLTILQSTGSVYFLFLFFYSGLEYTLCFLAHLHFSYTSVQQGKMFLFMGLVMAVTQGGFVRRIRPGNEPLCALVGILMIIPSFILIGSTVNVSVFYTGLFLYSVSSGMVVPCLTTMASNSGPIDQKGTILGIFRSIGALARALGPFTASAAFWRLGSSICYYAGGTLFIIPLILLVQLRNKIGPNTLPIPNLKDKVQ